MTRTWFAVTVELLGGRGEDLWPWPGRIFALGPSHTFALLATAIDDGFARWDRSHLAMFTLADGRIVTDPDTGGEMVSSVGGPLPAVVDIETARVARHVEPGVEFQYTFDLGDNWVHRCVLTEVKIDPVDVVGIRPAVPLPYWGWGAIPDQYGRRWNGDDGESRPPRRPSGIHPMLMHSWPGRGQIRGLDHAELRRTIAGRDAAGFLAAIAGCEIDDVLQQIAGGIPMAIAAQVEGADDVALSIVNRLIGRGWPGDQILADDLLALLRGEPLPGQPVPVDLAMFSDLLDADDGFGGSAGCILDIRNGQAYPASSTDAGIIDEDLAIDVETDPDRWQFFKPNESRDRWQDMAAFGERQPRAVRELLDRAIEGKGAFRRFRDLIEENGLEDAWRTFATDRQLGRARDRLAEFDIRVLA